MASIAPALAPVVLVPPIIESVLPANVIGLAVPHGSVNPRMVEVVREANGLVQNSRLRNGSDVLTDAMGCLGKRLGMVRCSECTVPVIGKAGICVFAMAREYIHESDGIEKPTLDTRQINDLIAGFSHKYSLARAVRLKEYEDAGGFHHQQIHMEFDSMEAATEAVESSNDPEEKAPAIATIALVYQR